MFLHHNDFVIWREKAKIILAKFRIIGIVQGPNGEMKYVPRPEFWDTNKSDDPTIRVLTSVQFQFEGLNIDEVPENLEVWVSTNRGDEVERFQENQEENYLEYSTRWPMMVKVKNRTLNKQTIFITSWTREPHSTLPKEYIFWFEVRKEESHLDEIDAAKAQKTAEEQLDGGDGKNGNTRRSRSRHHEEKGKRSYRPKPEQTPLHGLRGRSSAEFTETDT